MRKWLLAFAALILSLCLSYGKGLDGAWRALRAGNIL